MDNVSRPDPTQPRLLYPLVAVVALGLAVDMLFTQKLFGAPEMVDGVLTEAGELLENRYRLAAALLIVEAAVALVWLIADLRRRRYPVTA